MTLPTEDRATATAARLEKIAWEIRLALIDMFSWGKAHHFGGSLSCAEIIAALYFHKMNTAPKNSPIPRAIGSS